MRGFCDAGGGRTDVTTEGDAGADADVEGTSAGGSTADAIDDVTGTSLPTGAPEATGGAAPDDRASTNTIPARIPTTAVPPTIASGRSEARSTTGSGVVTVAAITGARTSVSGSGGSISRVLVPVFGPGAAGETMIPDVEGAASICAMRSGEKSPSADG